MSDEDISIIHSKTCTILEELYDAKGQPAELDDIFIQEYFDLARTSLGLTLEAGEPRAPHQTNARLSKVDRGLIDVRIASKKEKFLVSTLSVVKTITGTSQRFGSARGSGTYLMTDVKGIPNITMKTGSAVVTFVGLPSKVATEAGTGKWAPI